MYKMYMQLEKNNSQSRQTTVKKNPNKIKNVWFTNNVHKKS